MTLSGLKSQTIAAVSGPKAGQQLKPGQILDDAGNPVEKKNLDGSDTSNESGDETVVDSTTGKTEDSQNQTRTSSGTRVSTESQNSQVAERELNRRQGVDSSKILNSIWENKGAETEPGTSTQDAARTPGVTDYLTDLRERVLKAPEGTGDFTESERTQILNDFPSLQETLSTTDKLVGGYVGPDEAGFVGNNDQLALAGGFNGAALGSGQNIAPGGNANSGIQQFNQTNIGQIGPNVDTISTPVQEVYEPPSPSTDNEDTEVAQGRFEQNSTANENI